MAAHQGNQDPTHDEKCAAEIKKYLETRVGDTVTLDDFLRSNEDFIVENSPEHNFKSFWATKFGNVAKALKIKTTKKKPDWTSIEEALRNLNSASASSSSLTHKRSRSSSQCSKTDPAPLSKAAREQFSACFAAMENDKKWVIRQDDQGNNIYLEDIMYAFGNECSHEHPVHSFIMDPTDACWETKLSVEERKSISSAGDSGLPELPSTIKKIFEDCALAVKDLEDEYPLTPDDSTNINKAIISAMWKELTKFGFFDPVSQPEQDWLQRSMFDYLCMYRNNTLHEIVSHGSEMDFMSRCWVNLDRCFENVATVGRDRTCISTLVRVNSQRSVSGIGPIDPLQPAVRPDLLVMADGLEYAVGECGKDDLGGIGKKELVERRLHVPKVMKDVLNKTVSKAGWQASLVRSLKVVAMNNNSTRMQLSVLDCPAGYICRLTNTREFEIPQTADMITTDLFPILKHTLQAKIIICNGIKMVKQHRRNRGSNDEQLCLPQCLTVTSKKQKVDTTPDPTPEIMPDN